MLLGDRTTGKVRRPVLVDAETGEQMTPANTTLLPGPAAGNETHKRIALMRALRKQQHHHPD